MTRSLLRPLRTRRVIRPAPARQNDSGEKTPAVTPGTRKTLAVIGALWVSFATSASASSATPASAASVNPPDSGTDPVARGHSLVPPPGRCADGPADVLRLSAT